MLHTVFAHNESNKNMPGRLILMLVINLMHCDSDFQTTYIVHLVDFWIFTLVDFKFANYYNVPDLIMD